MTRKFLLILTCLLGILILAACNLGAANETSRLVPTNTPIGGVVAQPTRPTQVVRPSVTPLFGSSNATRIPIGVPWTPAPTTIAGGSFNAQNVPGQTGVVVVTPTRAPGSVTVTIPTGQIAATANDLFSVLYNFVSSAVTSLWGVAGAQGGFTTQVFCCIVPGAIAALYFLNRLRRPFRRR